MLTDVLHHHLRHLWITRWLKENVKTKPRLIDLDHQHNLVLEYGQQQDVVWSPDRVLKLLRRRSDAAVECCYRLGRFYDDCQDTSIALRAGLLEHYDLHLAPTVFWWARFGDSCGVVTETETKKESEDLRWWQDDNTTHMIWLASKALHKVLWVHLRERAFPKER